MDRKETKFKTLTCLGLPAEARIYNPREKKLNFRTVSGYFIGYPEKSKGYRFYCPNHSTRIVETGNARFIENGEINGSDKTRNVIIQEVRVHVPLPILPKEKVIPLVVDPINNNEDIFDEPLSNDIIINDQIVEQPQEPI